MPPPGKAPKPAWKEMVAPYSGKNRNWKPSPIGYSDRSWNASWLWLTCYKCECRFAVPCVPYIIRFGPDAPTTVYTTKTRCICCGRMTLVSQVPGYRADLPTGEHEPFPVERGYCALKAKYDALRRLPAPLRGLSANSRPGQTPATVSR